MLLSKSAGINIFSSQIIMKLSLLKLTKSIPFLMIVGVLGMFALVTILNASQNLNSIASQNPDRTQSELDVYTKPKQVSAQIANRVNSYDDKPSTKPETIPLYPEHVRLSLQLFTKAETIERMADRVVAFILLDTTLSGNEFERIRSSIPFAKAILLQSIFVTHTLNIIELGEAISLSFPEIINDCPNATALISGYNGVQIINNVRNQYGQQVNILQGIIQDPNNSGNQAIFDNVVRVGDALYNIIMRTVKPGYMNILKSCYTGR